MKVKQWFAVNRNGITKVRKTKPDLAWNELAFQIELEIPDELFQRPTISAKVQIKDVPNTAYEPEVILNTKELIEQQTGAKVEMRVITDEENL